MQKLIFKTIILYRFN